MDALAVALLACRKNIAKGELKHTGQIARQNRAPPGWTGGQGPGRGRQRPYARPRSAPARPLPAALRLLRLLRLLSWMPLTSVPIVGVRSVAVTTPFGQQARERSVGVEAMFDVLERFERWVLLRAAPGIESRGPSTTVDKPGMMGSVR